MAISNSDGSIVLTTKVDQSGLKKGMSTMKSGVSSLTGAFGKLAGAIGVAFSVGAIVKFSKEASNLATQTESSVQRLIDIYGSASQAVGNFIDANANALGISKSAAASYASVYGNLFSVWADQQTNAALTTQYLNMTAVVASKTGRTVEDVQERIRSGLLGNTEAIEDLGIFVNVKTIEMTDAFQKMAGGKSWEQLDAYTQQQIRSMAILEQATAKYGDEVANTSALTKAQFQAAWQDFQATWGQVVNRVLMPVLDVLTDILLSATSVMQALFNITGATISQGDATEEVTEKQEELTDAVKSTEKATKKVLAGFDDIQILSGDALNVSDNVGNLEITGSNEISNIDTSGYEGLKQILEEISGLFLSGFWQGFGDSDFSQPLGHLKSIGGELNNIIANISPKIQAWAETLTMSFGQVSGSIGSIGSSIANNLLGGIDQYLTENSPFITDKVGAIFDASSRMSEAVGNTFSSFSRIWEETIGGENGKALTGNMVGIFANAGLPIVELASKTGADWMTNLSTAISDNEDGLSNTLDGVLGYFSSMTGSVEQLVTDTGESLTQTYDEHLKPLYDSMGEIFSGWVETFTSAWEEDAQPVLDRVSKEFDELVKEHIKPMVDKVVGYIQRVIDLLKVIWENWLSPIVNWLISIFVPMFSSAFSSVSDTVNTVWRLISGFIGGIFEYLGGIVDFIKGVFTRDWETAWNGVKSAFSGIFDSLAAIVKAPINLIIDAVNVLIRGLNKVSFNLPNWKILGDWAGKTLGINIPTIPKLAQGAVIPPNREFLAVLGDQKHGTNIEAPLQTIVDAFNIALQKNGAYRNSGNTEVVLEIDGREFGRAVVEQGSMENKRIGTRLVIA